MTLLVNLVRLARSRYRLLSLTVTLSGQAKSVTVTECHSKRVSIFCICGGVASEVEFIFWMWGEGLFGWCWRRHSGQWLRYTTLQNLFPVFPWIAPGWRTIRLPLLNTTWSTFKRNGETQHLSLSFPSHKRWHRSANKKRDAVHQKACVEGRAHKG